MLKNSIYKKTVLDFLENQKRDLGNRMYIFSPKGIQEFENIRNEEILEILVNIKLNYNEYAFLGIHMENGLDRDIISIHKNNDKILNIYNEKGVVKYYYFIY